MYSMSGMGSPDGLGSLFSQVSESTKKAQADVKKAVAMQQAAASTTRGGDATLEEPTNWGLYLGLALVAGAGVFFYMKSR